MSLIGGSPDVQERDLPGHSPHTAELVAAVCPETAPRDTPAGGPVVSAPASLWLPAGRTHPLSQARSRQSHRELERKPHPLTSPAAPSVTWGRRIEKIRPLYQHLYHSYEPSNQDIYRSVKGQSLYLNYALLITLSLRQFMK